MKTTLSFLFGATLFCRSLLAGDSPNPTPVGSLRPDGKPTASSPAKPKPDDECCKEVAAGAFSKNSIYQADAKFTDDAGRSFALGSLKGRPVALAMFFANCTYACPLLLTDLHRIRELLPPAVRSDTVFVLVSFDVARDTPVALHRFRETRQLDGSWVLLHGDDAAVRELAALLGVKFKQEADGNFAHSNLITILNREGEVVYQRVGLKDGHAEAAAALR
jgi:protein SCO1/2